MSHENRSSAREQGRRPTGVARGGRAGGAGSFRSDGLRLGAGRTPGVLVKWLLVCDWNLPGWKLWE